MQDHHFSSENCYFRVYPILRQSHIYCIYIYTYDVLSMEFIGSLNDGSLIGALIGSGGNALGNFTASTSVAQLGCGGHPKLRSSGNDTGAFYVGNGWVAGGCWDDY